MSIDSAKHRIRLVYGGGDHCGWGVIVDPCHVVTCTHVVCALLGKNYDQQTNVSEFDQNKKLRLPDRLGVPGLEVVAWHTTGEFEDICLLRADAPDKQFPSGHLPACFGSMAAEKRFEGEGANRNVPEGYAINGTVDTSKFESGTPDYRRYYITTGVPDHRVDEGCSGAGLFEVGGTGAFIGMVAEFQLAMSGIAISADLIAAFLDSLKPKVKVKYERAGPISLEVPATIGKQPLLDLDNKLPSLNRSKQKGAFKSVWRDGGALKANGYALVTVFGQKNDDPPAFAEHLGANELSVFMHGKLILDDSGGQENAPVRLKPVPVRSFHLSTCRAGDGVSAEEKIWSQLACILLNTAGAEPDHVIHAFNVRANPLVLHVKARAEEFLTIEKREAQNWQQVLERLTCTGKPVPLILSIEGEVSEALQDAISGWALDSSFQQLPQLDEIKLEEVEDWAEGAYGEYRSDITRHIKNRAAGREAARLAEIKAWLEEGI